MESNQDEVIKKASQDYIALAVRDADSLWKKIIQTMKDNTDMRNWDDNKKIEYFYKDHKDFYNEFPIVCRYMITVGQYSTKAFAKYLTLRALDAKNTPEPSKREKTYIRDRWIKREADYVKLLWKSYRKGKYTDQQLREVYQQAYESLKAEFDDFQDNYKQIEEKLKQEKMEHQKQLVKEALERTIKPDIIHDNIDRREDKGVIPPPKENDVDIERKKRLKELLQIRLVEQRKAKVMGQIRTGTHPMFAIAKQELQSDLV